MNEIYFNNLVRGYPNLQGIVIGGNQLKLGDSTYEIKELNLEEYFKNNMFINASLDKITSQELFSILKTEDVSLQQQKMASKNELEVIQEVNPLIKNIGYITKKDEFGIDRNYVHYVDEQGVDHVLYQYAPGDVLRTYQELLSTQGATITEKDLFDALNRKMKNVGLDALENLQNPSESFSSALKSLDQGAGAARVRGNEEHQMAVVDNDVYMYQKDDQGNLIRTKYSLNQEGESFTQEQTQDAIVEKEQTDEEVIFISEEKFYELIMVEKSLSEEEQKQVDLFYGFLSDVMLYQDYLSEESKGFWRRYESFIIQIQLKSNEQSLSSKEEEILNKYNELCEKKRTEELSQEKANGLQRKLVNPKTTGSFLGVAIVLCCILLGIVIAWVMMK